MKMSPLEALCWSIALPGFGQLLNKKYAKGILLILLEIVINVGSNLNLIIIYSFHGDTALAVQHTNFQWLMFYPCVYIFGIWDAYKDAGGGIDSRYSFLPFISCAYLGTIGIIYSSSLRIFGQLLGPMWLGLLFAFIGLALGWLITKYVKNTHENEDKG